MKTKIFLGCLVICFILAACKKERVLSEEIFPSNTLYQQQLEELELLIPDNVEILTRSTQITDHDFPIFLPDTTITLTDCKEQQCTLVVPNYLRQMQRTANQFCQPMTVNICCCAKNFEWCFKFKVHPQFTCAPLKKDKFIRSEKGILIEPD